MTSFTLGFREFDICRWTAMNVDSSVSFACAGHSGTVDTNTYMLQGLVSSDTSLHSSKDISL